MQNTVYPLFPCPLVVCEDRYAFSQAEQEFLAGLEMTDNVGNLVSTDAQVLDREAMAELRAFIDSRVFNYKKNLLRIRDDNEIYITQSWVNHSKPGAYHPRHRHQNSVVSGVMYLGSNTHEALPPIRFHRTLDMFSIDFSFDELNEFNASSREFDPVPGMLILFPSSVDHSVEQNRTGLVRQSLSFNTFVRGTVGGKEQLTEVTLS